MGYPYDTASWDAAGGPIFMGWGTSLPGIFTMIAIAICIAALVIGQAAEAAKYRNHK